MRRIAIVVAALAAAALVAASCSGRGPGGTDLDRAACAKLATTIAVVASARAEAAGGSPSAASERRVAEHVRELASLAAGATDPDLRAAGAALGYVDGTGITPADGVDRVRAACARLRLA